MQQLTMLFRPRFFRNRRLMREELCLEMHLESRSPGRYSSMHISIYPCVHVSIQSYIHISIYPWGSDFISKDAAFISSAKMLHVFHQQRCCIYSISKDAAFISSANMMRLCYWLRCCIYFFNKDAAFISSARILHLCHWQRCCICFICKYARRPRARPAEPRRGQPRGRLFGRAYVSRVHVFIY